MKASNVKASNKLIGYAGVYSVANDAQWDFEVIKDAHRQNWIGTYDAALFTKDRDGKISVLDTDATQRATGARAGAVVGAVIGMIFPPSVLAASTAGAAAGAALGDMLKGFGEGDLEELARKLAPGESGILLIADAAFDAGAQKPMKRADTFAKQVVATDTAEMKVALAVR
jgi:uncharacterized membrane protein